jgi:hypothetical protein
MFVLHPNQVELPKKKTIARQHHSNDQGKTDGEAAPNLQPIKKCVLFPGDCCQAGRDSIPYIPNHFLGPAPE